jgi:predicted NBD/HSP70 family sugar kinase
MAVGLIDIGGTSIKLGVSEDDTIVDQESVATPSTLAEFYAVLRQAVARMKQHHAIVGVSVSAPGSVDKKAGVIRGASAIPYIHNFSIVSELVKQFGVPVAIENDANCSTLAEARFGAAKEVANVVGLIIGSGVGGGVVINGQIMHGAHLLGGEFGYMLSTTTGTVSDLGTAVNMAKQYNEAVSGSQVDGKALFALAKTGDEAAKKLLDQMYAVLAKTIFNIQYSIDPDCFVIGGGIANNADLLPNLKHALDKVMATVTIAEVRPDIRLCAFRSEANLRGALATYQLDKERGII